MEKTTLAFIIEHQEGIYFAT